MTFNLRETEAMLQHSVAKTQRKLSSFQPEELESRDRRQLLESVGVGEILERRKSERGAPNSVNKLWPSLWLILEP